jgi:uncharacterized protein (DUF1778 family)
MKKSPMTTVVTMRVSPSLEALLRKAAEHEAVGLSTFVRMAVKKAATRVVQEAAREKRRAA